MIPDASPVLAIIFGEPGFEVFDGAIADAESCSISAATFVETTMVAESRPGDTAVRQSDGFFRNAKVSIVPVTGEQTYVACQAFSNYGKGHHPAGLNFGDTNHCPRPRAKPAFPTLWLSQQVHPCCSKVTSFAKPTCSLPSYRLRCPISYSYY